MYIEELEQLIEALFKQAGYEVEDVETGREDRLASCVVTMKDGEEFTVVYWLEAGVEPQLQSKVGAGPKSMKGRLPFEIGFVSEEGRKSYGFLHSYHLQTKEGPDFFVWLANDAAYLFETKALRKEFNFRAEWFTANCPKIKLDWPGYGTSSCLLIGASKMRRFEKAMIIFETEVDDNEARVLA